MFSSFSNEVRSCTCCIDFSKNAVTLFKESQFDQQLTDRLKKFYEPVLYQMVGDKESKNIVERYGVYLRELLERNKEMTRIGVDSTVN